MYLCKSICIFFIIQGGKCLDVCNWSFLLFDSCDDSNSVLHSIFLSKFFMYSQTIDVTQPIVKWGDVVSGSSRQVLLNCCSLLSRKVFLGRHSPFESKETYISIFFFLPSCSLGVGVTVIVVGLSHQSIQVFSSTLFLHNLHVALNSTCPLLDPVQY